jgi:hypothetical protein
MAECAGAMCGYIQCYSSGENSKFKHLPDTVEPIHPSPIPHLWIFVVTLTNNWYLFFTLRNTLLAFMDKWPVKWFG